MNIHEVADLFAADIRLIHPTDRVEIEIWHNTYDDNDHMQADINWENWVISVSYENGKIECLELSVPEEESHHYNKMMDAIEDGSYQAPQVAKNIKQVIVIRKLGMRRGKECAQAAHASIAFLTRRLKTIGGGGDGTYQSRAVLGILTPAEWSWINGDFTKVVVQVDSEEALLNIHEAAIKAGLESHLIKDAGKTEFGEPTYTTVGIGPDEAEKIDEITGDLKLY